MQVGLIISLKDLWVDFRIQQNGMEQEWELDICKLTSFVIYYFLIHFTFEELKKKNLN